MVATDSRVQRVLLIRLSALGDVVLVSAAARALEAAHPGVAVDLVTDARYAAFAKACMGVREVVPYDRHGEDAGFAGVKRVQARLPTEPYDAVVDLQGKLRTRALAKGVSAERRLVLTKRTVGQAALALVGHDPPIVDRRAATLYLEALAPLGVSPEASPAPALVAPPGARPEGGPQRFGLSVGASHATKRWPAERFAELAEGLLELRPGARLVLIGGPMDAETLAAVRAALGPEHVEPEDPAALDVLGLATRIAGLDMMVSVDSGPAHLSAGFGVPTVVLFGPTAPSRWGPVGDAHASVSLDLDCAPCSNTGGARCPRPDRSQACLQELSPERVLEAARGVLERAGR